jgi:hypothetical protein
MPVRANSLLALGFAALALSSPAGAQPRARNVRPDPDENLQWAASVVQLTELRGQGDLTAKLFGTAGGDPAMNGLYTYLAFFGSPDEGWRVFRLGDFLSYSLVSEAPGRLVVEVRESIMDRSSGEIGERRRRVRVTWRAAGGDPPASVAVTFIP